MLSLEEMTTLGNYGTLVRMPLQTDGSDRGPDGNAAITSNKDYVGFTGGYLGSWATRAMRVNGTPHFFGTVNSLPVGSSARTSCIRTWLSHVSGSHGNIAYSWGATQPRKAWASAYHATNGELRLVTWNDDFNQQITRPKAGKWQHWLVYYFALFCFPLLFSSRLGA